MYRHSQKMIYVKRLNPASLTDGHKNAFELLASKINNMHTDSIVIFSGYLFEIKIVNDTEEFLDFWWWIKFEWKIFCALEMSLKWFFVVVGCIICTTRSEMVWVMSETATVNIKTGMQMATATPSKQPRSSHPNQPLHSQLIHTNQL